MTKADNDEVLRMYTYKRLGHTDIVARVLSAMIRATLSKKDRDFLLQQAKLLEVQYHPEFII